MSDLIAAIRAAIDETEQIAVQAALVFDSEHWTSSALNGREPIYSKAGTFVAEASNFIRPHIARHDPAAVLRRCDADRKILDLLNDAKQRQRWDGEAYMNSVMEALAASYGIEV